MPRPHHVKAILAKIVESREGGIKFPTEIVRIAGAISLQKTIASAQPFSMKLHGMITLGKRPHAAAVWGLAAFPDGLAASPLEPARRLEQLGQAAFGNFDDDHIGFAQGDPLAVERRGPGRP